MTENKNQINIARLIYEAYPHADLLPIDPDKDCRNLQALLAKVTNENIGDSLFRFIVVEIVEGGEGTLEGAIRVMERAKEDVEVVLRTLQTKQSCLSDYCKAAEYLAEQGRKVFTGPNQGGVWNAACLDACILSHKQDDKAAYEYLLNFAVKYSKILTESERLLLEQIKANAAALLKSEEPHDAVNNKPT